MDSILGKILSFHANDSEDDIASHSPPNALEGPPEDLTIAVIAFSKERPYQLHQLLRSMKLHLNPLPVVVKVLYVPGDYEKEYEDVFHYYHSLHCDPNEPRLRVEACRQSNDFHYDLKNCIEDCSAPSGVVGTSHILFVVDDLIFFSQVDLMHCARALTLSPDAFTVHLKLHPGITYSHAANKYCPPPVLKPLTMLNGGYSADDTDISFCKFELAGGKVDWRYPFDLCASLYRTSDMKRLMQSFEQQNLSSANQNPNRFETFGNQIFWKLSARPWSSYKHCLCSAKPVLTVVTINQVQATYKVPIYQNPTLHDRRKEQELNGLDMSDLAVLNRQLLCINGTKDTSKNFDLPRYRHLLSSSVHIGDIYLLPRHVETSDEIVNTNDVKVTILLPIYNGEIFLERCLRHIKQLSTALPFHLLIIDDGSVDNSQELIQIFLETNMEFMNINGCECKVIQHSVNQGLAKTLDEGLRIATTEYIARIDVDDEILPMRLVDQVAFLDGETSRRQGIHVVGCQAILKKCEVERSQGQAFISNIACHPTLVYISMFFHCALLHPSVCFRRDIALECGGYSGDVYCKESKDLLDHDEKTKYIEDYCLWWKILKRYPNAIANLPNIGVIIHQHRESKSQMEAQKAKEARFDLLELTWTELLQAHSQGDKDCIEHLRESLKVILQPKDFLKSKEDQTRALHLLDRFQTCIVHQLQDLQPNKCGESPETKEILNKCVKAKIDQYRKQINAIAKISIHSYASNSSCVETTTARPEVEDIMHRLANML